MRDESDQRNALGDRVPPNVGGATSPKALYSARLLGSGSPLQGGLQGVSFRARSPQEVLTSEAMTEFVQDFVRSPGRLRYIR